MSKLLSKGKSRKLYVEHGFRLLDIDGDGFIGLEDLQNSIQSIGNSSTAGKMFASLPHRELEQMIRQFDLDGDGKCKHNFFVLIL